MARKIRTLEEAPVDVVEAVKRGVIWRGFIPRKYRRNSQLADNKAKNENPPQQSQTSGEKPAPKIDDSAKMPERGPNPPQDVSRRMDEEDPGEIHEKLIDLAEKSHDKLMEANTVFPFTPFPHTVSLDREKLTIANREFFRVAKIITVPVTSIISAEADVGPFFGAVHITSKYFLDNTHSIKYLWRNDAEKLQRMLQGYIIANERGIDVTEVDKPDLTALLEDLGHGA